MLSILVIAAARESPIASAEGSLNVAGSGEATVAPAAGAGDGVAGGFVAAVVTGGATGAGGAAGVDTFCAGVDGSATGLGAGFGFDVMQTMKPFSSIL